MEYRRFGKTELKMPVFSCGGMRYQYKWEDLPLDDIPDDNQKNLEATILWSLELGINHIETARGYGSSERQLGVILPALPREKMIIQTKVAPEADPEKFVGNFMDSLKRLKLEYVDLLSLHGVNNRELLEQCIKPNGCLKAARKLQKDGLARHIGFSTHASPDVIMDAVKHEENGGFDYVNLHWYYIMQNNWPAIEEAARRDLGVFIISPTDKGGMLYKPSDKLVKLCHPLHPIIFNDLFCLNRPEVHTLSIGTSCPGDFDLHVETLNYLAEAEKHLPAIESRLREAMVEAVGGDFADRYKEGLPLWEDTPGNTNIPVILWLRNLVAAYDMVEYGKMRYNLLGNGGHWFPGENVEKLPKEDLPKIISRSPFADKIPDILNHTHALLKAEEVKRLSTGE